MPLKYDRSVDRLRANPWVGDDKIASIGVHLSRWLTTHGFALNLSTDLSYFAGIVACGLEGVRMTSVERLTGRRIEPAAVAGLCAGHLAAVFERRLEPLAEDRLAALRG